MMIVLIVTLQINRYINQKSPTKGHILSLSRVGLRPVANCCPESRVRCESVLRPGPGGGHWTEAGLARPHTPDTRDTARLMLNRMVIYRDNIS